MQLRSVKYYLSNLIRDGHFWQYTNINGVSNAPYLYFTGVQWILIVISTLAILAMPSGFTTEFIGYVITSLSIFIGLFLTLILSVFDKFSIEYSNTNELSEKARIKLKQRKNFSKQFTSLTAYAIVLSIFCLILLCLPLLSNFWACDITKYHFIGKIENLNWNTISCFFYIVIILLHRVLILYFLQDFILITVYALASMYVFIRTEYDRAKIN